MILMEAEGNKWSTCFPHLDIYDGQTQWEAHPLSL